MYAVHISNLSIRHRSAAVITIIVRLIIKFKYYCAAEKKFLFFSFLNPTIPFFQDIFYNIFFFCSIWLSTRSNETLTNYQTTAIDRSNPAFWFLQNSVAVVEFSLTSFSRLFPDLFFRIYNDLQHQGEETKIDLISLCGLFSLHLAIVLIFGLDSEFYS